MMKIQDFSNYKDFVKEYLKEAQEENPLFSLRSLAKKADISPSQLSSVLSGSKKISLPHAEKLGKAIGLSDVDYKFFMLLVSYELSENPSKEVLKQKLDSKKSKKDLVEIPIAEAPVDLNWEHLFILVYLEAGEPYLQAKDRISKLLNLELKSTEKIISDLIKKDLLTLYDDQIQGTHKRIAFSSPEASKVLQEMHQAYLIKSKELLTVHDVSKRYSVTEFSRVSKENLPRLKEITNEYLDLVSSLKSDKETEDCIVGISLHLNSFID